MTENQVEATEGSRRPPRWRYLIDIIVLVVITFILDAILGALVHEPISWKTGFVLDAIGKILLVGVGCGLVLLRGCRFRRPQGYWRRCRRKSFWVSSVDQTFDTQLAELD